MTDGKTLPKKKKDPRTTFLRDHGHGPDRLGGLFARVDWSRADAFPRARDALALFISTIAELLLADARVHRQTPGARLNALVVGNDAAEAPLLGLALQHLEAAGPLPRLLPGTRAALASAAATLPAHSRLLREGSLPAHRLPELVDIDTDALLPLLARQTLAEGPATPAVTLKWLKLAAHGENRRGTLLRRARLVQKLLAGSLPAAALDYRGFRALPTPMRDVVLFTPALSAALLDPQAQAAARPPSPDFDPLYLEHALSELGRGRLSHVELDTLFLGAATPAFRARIVAALAEGSGDLACDEDIRERLIAGAAMPEICLLACAAAASPQDVRRALATLPSAPRKGVLGEALHRFAVIAWCDAMPSEVPETWRSQSLFAQDLFNDCEQQLLALLQGKPTRRTAAALFRQFTGWLALVQQGRQGRRASGMASALDEALATQGQRLAADIDGNDLFALYSAGSVGARLARRLAGTLREHNAARWEHGFFIRLADLDPQVALALAGHTPAAREADILRQLAGTHAHRAGDVGDVAGVADAKAAADAPASP